MSKKNEEIMEELSKEEIGKKWEQWVRSEVNAILDIYLPVAFSSHTNVKYIPVELEKLESGSSYSENLMKGVDISLIFEFDKPIDISKPR